MTGLPSVRVSADTDDAELAMVIVAFGNATKQGKTLWKAPWAIEIKWNRDAYTQAAADAWQRGVVVRMLEDGWLAELNDLLTTEKVVTWYVGSVVDQEDGEREHAVVISGHAWIGDLT